MAVPGSPEAGTPASWDGAVEVVARARLVVSELGPLPLPGGGSTAARWQALADVAAEDLSLVRIVEGHYDALAILAELGHRGPVPGGLLGVWAARPEQLAATGGDGGWVLSGSKPFCSGSTLLDAALVTATSEGGPRLFLVDARAPAPVPGTWEPLGMAATRSETLRFDGVVVSPDAEVGMPGAYVERPGFGHGGCGVAACWWGGAAGLVAALGATVAERPDDLRLAAYGDAALAVEGAGFALRAAASQIDDQPLDPAVATRCAAVTRRTVAGAAHAILGSAATHLGTSVLGVDGAVAARFADLTTYLTQHRAGDAVDLGRQLLAARPARLC